MSTLSCSRDRILGGFVRDFDELIAGDGAGVVVCVGFLEVWGACWNGNEGRVRVGDSVLCSRQ